MAKAYPIKNELDFLVARAQGERREAEALLVGIRGEGDYWREKSAAKLAVFFDLEAQFLSHLAELKDDYPELLAVIEERKSHLTALQREARTMYAMWQHQSGPDNHLDH